MEWRPLQLFAMAYKLGNFLRWAVLPHRLEQDWHVGAAGQARITASKAALARIGWLVRVRWRPEA